MLMAVQELNNKIKVYRAMKNISQEELAIAIRDIFELNEK